MDSRACACPCPLGTGCIEASSQFQFRSGGLSRLTVTDTGRGIDPEFLPHVFERFRPADDPGAASRAGLGLGLSIVRHLVEAHGGKVSAHSDGIGKGATITVELPLVTTAHA